MLPLNVFDQVCIARKNRTVVVSFTKRIFLKLRKELYPKDAEENPYGSKKRSKLVIYYIILFILIIIIRKR